MQRSHFKRDFTTTFIGILVLLLGATLGFAQSVSLTAGATSLTLPDGSSVPMWGYSCGVVSGAACAKLNASTTGWSSASATRSFPLMRAPFPRQGYAASLLFPYPMKIPPQASLR